MKNTGDQQLVKRINRSLILRLLRKPAALQTGLSRAQLAKASGLTKSTVSLLVLDLLQEGWLMEGDLSNEASRGRPSTPLRMDTTRKALIGVEVAVDSVRVVGVSLIGSVLCTRNEPLTNASPSDACKQVAKMTAGVHKDLLKRGMQLHGVGVGVPGAFDTATGRLSFAPNLGWRDIDFVPLITKAFARTGMPAVPVFVQNEADTSALSEYEFANNNANDSLIFVTCGVGVGAGIVLNDRLFTGVQGMAGEIGHSILQIGGAQCSCGRRGCAETFFGERVLSKMDDPSMGGKYLGLVLHNLWTTFNPGTLVVGGSSCVRYPSMVDVASKALAAYANSAGITPAPKVRTASYGILAAAVGAAALVLHQEQLFFK
ncbi:MAG: ROK family transcriptional regulator [Cytophagales bacterium]|nr:ROK family transcriptional regulator [Cytophagales bacterium]